MPLTGCPYPCEALLTPIIPQGNRHGWAVSVGLIPFCRTTWRKRGVLRDEGSFREDYLSCRPSLLGEYGEALKLTQGNSCLS